ncbi:protein translocase subunit SecF [Clostridium sardiniense]|uniref:Protein-export membrane protein SecF n=1 Tax=Clostridium sardiniense TaxID=29369 RepID=A0ABS7KWB5_CLOSR|nr:protein translocase subunit SecF [Clostridium sardiniense]MBY0755115.1 protein translocase subunit SecF [Clostridium sardiniense]MDQ0459027.1 preprotein translocase SecF subunit [Clostridium sardiniense]
MLKIIEHAKIWIALSLAVIVIGLGFMFTRGLNFGIDFKGGTQVVFNFGKEFDKAAADNIVKKYSPEAVTNTVNSTEYEIKAPDLSSQKVNEIYDEFKKDFKIGDKALVSQNEIGASIGKELTQKAFIALAIAFVCMLIYIAIRFEIKFGIAALIALFHDILITLSVYAIFNITVNSPFIAAILTIVGYSINDTIVIFDRIRENSKFMRRTSPTEIADKSLTQTMSRSINTTLTTLITIIAVNIFVPTVREFSFPLIIGIATGAYSSIFIASPMWVWLQKKGTKKKVVEA